MGVPETYIYLQLWSTYYIIWGLDVEMDPECWLALRLSNAPTFTIFIEAMEYVPTAYVPSLIAQLRGTCTLDWH